MEGEEGTQQQPPVLPVPYRAASDAQPMNPLVKKKQNDPKPPSQMWGIYGGLAALKFPIRIPNVVSDPTRCWDRIQGHDCGFLTTKKENNI